MKVILNVNIRDEINRKKTFMHLLSNSEKFIQIVWIDEDLLTFYFSRRFLEHPVFKENF
jgi:hypothetical protein